MREHNRNLIIWISILFSVANFNYKLLLASRRLLPQNPGYRRRTVLRKVRPSFNLLGPQILQKINENGKELYQSIFTDILPRCDKEEVLVTFSITNESSMWAAKTRQNASSWGSENPHVVEERVPGSPTHWGETNFKIGSAFYRKQCYYLNTVRNFVYPYPWGVSEIRRLSARWKTSQFKKKKDVKLIEHNEDRWTGRLGPVG
jgi:hypothetical protein